MVRFQPGIGYINYMNEDKPLRGLAALKVKDPERFAEIVKKGAASSSKGWTPERRAARSKQMKEMWKNGRADNLAGPSPSKKEL